MRTVIIYNERRVREWQAAGATFATTAGQRSTGGSLLREDASILRQGYGGQDEGQSAFAKASARLAAVRSSEDRENMCFCETNRIYDDGFFDATAYAHSICRETLKKLNPVRLVKPNPFWRVCGMANRVRGGETSAQREDAQQRVPTKALTEDQANGAPLCFCETNPPFFIRIFYATTNARGSCK